MRNWLLACTALALAAAMAGPAQAQALSKAVALAEKKRIEVINKVKPSVVAVMARDLRGNLTGNGSGVLIDAEGYALTNWHVTSAARFPVLKCGLPDGKVYDAVLVGLDKVGDVALIKLLPKKDGDKFPFAPLGDSDKCKAGDWSLAMGNPFSLATDFTPTVTFGLISGVHRYQYPAGTLLEYTDCIQIDTSINPGNSGGPLYNMDGELIGINGRGSFEKRGRVNSGVGYAISINQIKNFMGHLRAGIDTDHASLGASMESESEDEGALSKILVKNMIDSDARRRGLEPGDQLITFGGRPMTTVNQYKNVLGLFPRGWRVPMSFRRENQRYDTLVRLMGVQNSVVDERPGTPGKPLPGPPMPKMPPGPASPAAKFFKEKEGFANFYFNAEAQKAVLANLVKECDFTKKTGDWKLNLGGVIHTVNGPKDQTGAIFIREKGASDGKSPKVLADIDGIDYDCEPLNPSEKAEKLKDPAETGGLLVALYQYRQLLAFGVKGFVGEFSHGGHEPFYPPVKETKPDYLKIRVLCEVLRTKHAGVPARWFFALGDDNEGRWKKGQLIGFEVTVDRDEDPCEVCLMNYKDFGGNKLPERIHVRRGERKYADFTLTGVDIK